MPKSSRYDYLDLLRGLAAFLVLAGHLRGYLFVGYSDLYQAAVQVGVIEKASYFLTSLGHQAVIIFFALSGFLVGGRVLDGLQTQQFSWRRYLLRRLTRLWIVIVPALVLTLLLDRLGLWLTNGAGYDGRYHNLYPSGPGAIAGIDHSAASFLGNVLFLQTIFVPTFGSNGPMWSLANEFWYYIIFPLGVWLLVVRAPTCFRLLGFAVLISLIMVLPASLLEGGVIWASGAAAAWCSDQKNVKQFVRAKLWRWGAIVVLIMALVLSKVPVGPMGDLMLGIAVAGCLPVFAHMPTLSGPSKALARASSEVSYTLYLTHFPFLTLIVLAGVAPTRLQPAMSSVCAYFVLFLAAAAWATVVWWCFERNTERVYSWIIRSEKKKLVGRIR